MEFIKKQSHSIATFIIMLLCVGIGIEASVGMLIIGYFVGREYAQAEQRGISKFYGNHRANAPWYVGLKLKSWNLDSFLNDLIFPFLVVISFYK